jgi:hypothetical protein
MSWNDLEEKTPAQPSPEALEWQRLHSAVFGSGPGAELLEKYHKVYIDGAPAAGTTEAMLRFWLGQRAIISQMQRLTAAAVKAKPAK